jgi:hypothetical protein
VWQTPGGVTVLGGAEKEGSKCLSGIQARQRENVDSVRNISDSSSLLCCFLQAMNMERVRRLEGNVTGHNLKILHYNYNS